MQFIPLEQLKQLASDSILHESDAKSFSYDEFKQEYEKTLDFMKNAGSEEPIEATYKILLYGWLKDHCPPIKLIGQGSSRAAFGCSDGICLKIAINHFGTVQNLNEAINTMDSKTKGYLCFAQTYEKSNDNTSLLTECCSSITPYQWQEMWEIDDNSFVKHPDKYLLVAISKFYECNCNWDECIANLEKPQAMLMQRIKARKSPAMKTLASLFDFYAASKANYDKLSPYELCTANNWGAAIRFGKVAPVVIDSGLPQWH